MEIDPAKIDVNVSPTKSEVHFLNEDEMIEAVLAAVQTALITANTSRTYHVQVSPRNDTDLIGRRSYLARRNRNEVQHREKQRPIIKFERICRLALSTR